VRRCVKIQHRTRTCRTRLGNTAGLPVPVLHPRKQQQPDPESPTHEQPTKIVKKEKDFAVDNNVLKSKNVEMRHSLQRHFRGARLKPHTAPWIAQRIHEDPTPTAVGFL